MYYDIHIENKTEGDEMKSKHIHTKSVKEAWDKANEIFPTDYEYREGSKERAGYPIYDSTDTEKRYFYICDLGTRLEINMGSETVNIWIDEEEEKATMTATVRSMTNEFKEYKISGIVSVQYIGTHLILTSMEAGKPATITYNSAAVIIEIH